MDEMTPQNLKSQLMRVLFLLLLLSFVAHLLWDWLRYIAPMLMALAALAIIWRVVFKGRR
jgi:hypothetical protein